LLWPDKPQSAASRSLAVALSELRRDLGSGVIETQAHQVWIAPGAIHSDLQELEALPEQPAWRQVHPIIRGAVLQGVGSDLSAVEDWLETERRPWNRKAITVLMRTVAAELCAGRVQEATEAARRALVIDSLSEAAIMALMRALVLDGDRVGAIREYDAFAARIATELDTQPGIECSALADRVRRERGRPAAQALPTEERRRAPLVGRSADLAAVVTAWRRVQVTRRAAVTMLVGDMGMGKTRLGDEIAARARLDGATTVVTRAVESDLQAPWSGLLGLARGGLLDAPGLAAASAPALAWFATRIPEWADRFPALRPTASELLPAQAMSEVLRATVSEQPVVLRVDDAELLDRESLLALTAALRDLADHPLLLVLSFLPHPVRPELEELRTRIGRDVEGVVVRLGPFDLADIRELMRWAVPDTDDAHQDRLSRRVHTDSAGVPLLAVELLSAVAVGLDLQILKPDWPEPFQTLQQTLPGELPDGIVAAVRVVFHRLAPQTQRVLQAVAVLGDYVTAELVARAAALPPQTVIEALDELEWARWLSADGRGYTFAARIVRQVVERDLVLPGQRRRLRAAAGLDMPLAP
ncbi:MAG TPA: AAA family ATPase, partial [Gemmatimonadales bacterium]|nr:AAA family ATPase [Gemmatimonadales bacterium]